MHGDFLLRIAREKNLPPESLIDFASNINPFPPSDILDVIRSALNQIFYYPDDSYRSLVDVIASFLKCEEDEVVFGNGSIEIIRSFFAMHRGCVLIPYPTFTEYERFARLHGMQIIPARFDVDAIVHTIEDKKPQAVVLCNPNNPTGDLMGRKELGEIAELCEKFGTSLLIDEAFIDFTGKGFDGEAFIARSLTKILAIPGLRFGYGRFPRSYAKKFHEERNPWNVNVIAMRIAEHYLPLLDEFSRDVRKKIAEEREWLKRNLEKIEFKARGSANFLLVESEIPAKQVFEELLEKNILIRTCGDFRGLSEKHFRIAVKKREDNVLLINALKELRK